MLSDVDAVLFDTAHEAATAAALAAAISAAANVPATAVSVRRVRDVTNPAAPIVLYVNPQFAGDAFPARRRLLLQHGKKYDGSPPAPRWPPARRLQQEERRRLPATATVSVDAQILQASNVAAAALSASLASGVSFVTNVQGALAGSPLAGAQVAASVQPYYPTGAAGPGSSSGAASLAAGTAAGVVIVLVASAIFVYRTKRCRAAAAVAPEAAPDAGAMPTPKLPAAVDGQDWRTFNRAYLTGADMDYLVALGALDEDGKRVGARRANAEARARFSVVVLEKLVAFGVLL